MRIGILTGGGDAPGLNGVIRALTKKLLSSGVEVLGVLDGFEGLLHGRSRPLGPDDVSGILARGGTILGTANRGDSTRRMAECMETYRGWKLDGLVAIGGDGTLHIAHRFSKRGARVIGIPKTIDNDVAATDTTFGFDSAVSIAARSLEGLHYTADAHGRIMVVELMGRTAGWIALHAGIAGGADVILLPEIPHDLGRVADYIRDRHTRRRFTIVAVAEGAASGAAVGKELEKRTGIESRVMILGHLQRAGSPTPFDRVLATRYGYAAAELVLGRRFGRMTALRLGEMTSVPLATVAGKVRRVPRHHELVRVGLGIGTCFGF